jgi:hypothetical protein
MDQENLAFRLCEINRYGKEPGIGDISWGWGLLRWRLTGKADQ